MESKIWLIRWFEKNSLSSDINVKDSINQNYFENGWIDSLKFIDLVTQIEPSIFHVKAIMPIEEFNERFATSYSEEEFDTIGGIVLQAFGHMPERGDQVQVADINFEVLNADSRRVRLLRVNVSA